MLLRLLLCAHIIRGGKNTFQKYRSIKSMTGSSRVGADGGFSFFTGFLFLFEWDLCCCCCYQASNGRWISRQCCCWLDVRGKEKKKSLTVGETAAATQRCCSSVKCKSERWSAAARKEKKRNLWINMKEKKKKKTMKKTKAQQLLIKSNGPWGHHCTENFKETKNYLFHCTTPYRTLQ